MQSQIVLNVHYTFKIINVPNNKIVHIQFTFLYIASIDGKLN